MPGLGEECTLGWISWTWRSRQCLPGPSLELEQPSTKPSGKDAFSLVAMVFQPVTLEPLDRSGPCAFDGFSLLSADRVAEDLEATIVLPVVTDRTRDTQTGLIEAPLSGLCPCCSR